MDELSNKPTQISKLKPKHVRFANEYVIDRNATKAATRTGYSPKSAHNQGARLIKKEGIALLINQLEEKAADSLGINHHYVLSNMKEVVERCMQHAKVLDKKGDQVYIESIEGDLVPAYTFNAMGAVKGLELLGRRINTFDGDQSKADAPQWTGVEIDFGDGKLKVVTGTGQLPSKAKE